MTQFKLSHNAALLSEAAADKRQDLDYSFEALMADNKGKIPCGYATSVEDGPIPVSVPYNPAVLAARYVYAEWADYATYDEGGAIVADSASRLCDRDFCISHAMTSHIAHCRTTQQVSVANQPDWVTYVMNGNLLLPLLRSVRDDSSKLERLINTNDRFYAVELATKLIKGGLSWWEANADLLFTSVKLRFRYDGDERPSAAGYMERGLEQLQAANPDADDPTALFRLVGAYAREIVLQDWKAMGDNVDGIKDVVDALSFLPCDLGGSLIAAGVTAQREEAERMAEVNWPHICNRHPDRRDPQMHKSFGEFRVYGLGTVKERSFALPLWELGDVLCDENGRFLPYDEAVASLKAEFDDFADGPDLGELTEDIRQPFLNALSDVGLDSDRLHDVTIEDERYCPRIDEEGTTVGENVREVAFSVGPNSWVGWLVDGCGSLFEVKQALRQMSAAYIYNAYSDFSKQCWLVDRGFIDAKDELTVRERDPAKDLNAAQLGDFIDFCFEATDVDGPWHSLARYDGSGYEYWDEETRQAWLLTREG